MVHFPMPEVISSPEHNFEEMAQSNRKKGRRGLTISASVTTVQEDGTQVERKAPGRKKKAPSRMDRVGACPYQFDEAALKDFVDKTCATGVKGLADEFIKIKQETQTCTKPKTANDANVQKNRYRDVICIDETRVILKFPEGTTDDYIHANYVKTENSNKFICTQGPVEKTVDDLWRMVWQQSCTNIVMLCNIMELGKKKCEKYWPDDKATYCDGKLEVKVKNAPLEVEPNIILTKFTLTYEEKTLNIDHWQWKAWPDRGVPEIPMATFRLLAKIKTAVSVIVHCSAGIGRTGTIVGLDIAFSKLAKGETVCLEKIVRELRAQRHGSVQTEEQYVFMARVLLTLAENKKISNPEMNNFITQYDAFMKKKAGA